jgi:hypothetical protein
LNVSVMCLRQPKYKNITYHVPSAARVSAQIFKTTRKRTYVLV